jgi:imidazolonepropionase-like amidohydrolase
LDAPEFDSLIAALIENKVTVDPTLVLIQSLYYGDDLKILDRLEPEAAPPSIHATWGNGWESANPSTMTSPQALQEGKVIWPIATEIVRRLQESGVNVAAGTDVGMPWITPGVSFHRELELLVEAGIPEVAVILIATRNGARGLGKEDLFGVVAPGLSADLVLLRQDPLIKIQNTRSIETVYLGGRPYDPSVLLADLR